MEVLRSKVCIQCGIEQPISEYHKAKRNKTGTKGTCKKCCALNAHKYKPKEAEYRKRYTSKPKARENRNRYMAEYRKTDKYKTSRKSPKITEYMEKYRSTEKHKAKKREVYARDKLKYRDKRLKQQKIYKKRPAVRLKNSISGNMRMAFKRAMVSKSINTIKVIGCTYGFLLKHIESQFSEGMTFDNYGNGCDKWNVDHILPLDAFDLANPIHVMACSNWRNLQPMWQIPNIQKGNKYKQEDFDEYIKLFTENLEM